MTGDAVQPDRARVRRVRRARGTRSRAIAGAALVAVLLAVVLVVRAVSLSAAQGEYDAAALAFQSEQTGAVQIVTAGETALDDAIATLEASDGKVLTEQPRTDLADAIDAATGRLSAAAQELTSAETTADASTASTTLFELGGGIRDDARALASFDFGVSAGVDGIAEDLAVPVAAVVTAMAEWQAEQDRILAERYTNNVHAIGWTPELDECIGSVDVTAHYQDVPTIAEHWSCGGKDFPDDAGTMITLTGVHAGTYRVDGIVAMLNASRNSTADVPRGYDLLYQTCQNGQSATMSFTALTRVS
ncbi:hypothetical protein BJQ94_07600 [Cryobacterium sp. SO2]|uniref:hypothetical protein n=1 Tax=Cryobacterium sp. SO2 TaxID=1897060 RepID=UPI00223E470A|nr:hypothetical protein [Cryobacterium sp. SO2]WEO78889.1 hypothetical protein BJQ94_07600 [Cryobacterium sp. SO2]